MKPRHHAFTLIELLVVMGLIGTLISLLMPVIGRTRAAARATACMSNLRQMGAGWTMYCGDSRGRLFPYTWNNPSAPDAAWTAYWPGALESAAIRGDVLFCPSADEPVEAMQSRGFGNATRAWNGRLSASGTPIKFSASLYRQGSYGYNRYMTAGGGMGDDGLATSLTQVRNLCEVPLFFDCAFADAEPFNGAEESPVPAPPDLQGGGIAPGCPSHWMFLIARHGRGINVCMADGSVRYVPLEDLYSLSWKGVWIKYRLSLPQR